MLLLHPSILLAGSIVLFSATQSVGEQICKPHLSFKDVQFSHVQDLRRNWTAVLDVDASRCDTSSGRFSIKFIRVKENAPELGFLEQFTWRQGRIEVFVGFAADEAVLGYSLGSIGSCACRN